MFVHILVSAPFGVAGQNTGNVLCASPLFLFVHHVFSFISLSFLRSSLFHSFSLWSGLFPVLSCSNLLSEFLKADWKMFNIVPWLFHPMAKLGQQLCSSCSWYNWACVLQDLDSHLGNGFPLHSVPHCTSLHYQQVGCDWFAEVLVHYLVVSVYPAANVRIDSFPSVLAPAQSPVNCRIEQIEFAILTISFIDLTSSCVSLSFCISSSLILILLSSSIHLMPGCNI